MNINELTRITELESLQNAANPIGLTIHEKYEDDKRKTVKLYYAQNGKETVSPVLDYEQLNHFLLGWAKCEKAMIKLQKLKTIFEIAPEMYANELKIINEAIPV